ncbi:MAG TPA: hypothetical protein PLY93_07045, partial [Turneriella sp.]|nr:hypothetical protein [Turneriella sp.]
MRDEFGSIVFNEPQFYAASNQSIVAQVKENYIDSPFTFIHFVDADNFAHYIGRKKIYSWAIQKEVEYSREIIEYIDTETEG